MAVAGWRGEPEYVEMLLDCMARWRRFARQWTILSEDVRHSERDALLRGAAAAALFAAHRAELEFLRCAFRERPRASADTEPGRG